MLATVQILGTRYCILLSLSKVVDASRSVCIKMLLSCVSSVKSLGKQCGPVCSGTFVFVHLRSNFSLYHPSGGHWPRSVDLLIFWACIFMNIWTMCTGGKVFSCILNIEKNICYFSKHRCLPVVLLSCYSTSVRRWLSDVRIRANDVQLAIDRLPKCMADVSDWLDGSRLWLNPGKTEVLWLGLKFCIDRITVRDISVLSVSIRVTDSARILGVVVDSRLPMADQVSSLCRYQLRQLRPVVRFITEDAAKIVVHTFIPSRLDYCNCLLCGIAGNLRQKLQSVQNAAAQLIMKTGRREHITPVLRELHWLQVPRRIDFKLAVLVYKALHGQLLQYLAEDCQLLTDIGRRSLRLADVLTCATRRTQTRLGDRSFSVAGPCLWNSLPVTLHDRDISLVQFKRLLKTLWFV